MSDLARRQNAPLQSRCWCDACNRETERATHDCGAATRFACLHGSSAGPSGQGHETIFVQIVADLLGIDNDQIRIASTLGIGVVLEIRLLFKLMGAPIA